MLGHENLLFGCSVFTHENWKSLKNYRHLSSIFFWGREREVEKWVTTEAGRRVQCLVLEDLSPLRMTRTWGRQLYAKCLEKKLNLFCVMHSNAKFHTLFRFGTPAAISRAVGIATAEKI